MAKKSSKFVDPEALKAAKQSKKIRFPWIKVNLSSTDGNAFSIFAAIGGALERAGESSDVVDEFMNDAASGDYNHVLETCKKWVTVS